MEIRIGMVNGPRELVINSPQSVEDLEKAIAAGLASENGTVRFEDEKGHIFVVASRTLAYVEIGQEKARKVGFAP